MPNPQPTFVIDSEGRRHLRGSAEYEAAVNPPDVLLQRLVERAERAADRAESSKRDIERMQAAGKGAPDDAPYMHRPTAGEPAREE